MHPHSSTAFQHGASRDVQDAHGLYNKYHAAQPVLCQSYSNCDAHLCTLLTYAGRLLSFCKHHISAGRLRQ